MTSTIPVNMVDNVQQKLQEEEDGKATEEKVMLIHHAETVPRQSR